MVFTLAVSLVPANFAGITAYADSAAGTSAGISDDEKENRKNEGQKNLSDDVDFWNEINIDQSFAYQVRMATNYANRQSSVQNDVGNEAYHGSLKMHNVAPFFGYTEGEIEDDVLNSPEFARMSRSSDSSVDYAKDVVLAFDDAITNEVGLGEASGYMYYGLALNLMGFDEVGSAAPDSTRQVYGTIALWSYKLASSVNVLFEMTFDFLEATNPFMFFKDINTASNAGSDELSNIYDTATGKLGSTNGISDLATFFGEIYNMFTEFAWAVSIPLSLIFILIAFFLTRRGRYSIGSNLKKFIVRVVFLVIGIPILGSAYTQVLDSLKDSQAMSDNFITQAVSYTFLDFSAWVENNRLAPPADTGEKSISVITKQQDGGSLSDAMIRGTTWLKLREMCSELNKQNGVFKTLEGNLSVSTSGALLKDFIYNDNGNMLSTTTSSSGSVDIENRENINSLLQRYTDGTKYTAVMFESGSIAWMQSQDDAGEASYGDMLALSCDKYSFSPYATRTVHGLQGGKTGYYKPTEPENAEPYSEVAKKRFEGNDFANVGYNIWNNGTISASVGNTSSTEAGGGNQDPIVGIRFSGQATAAGADKKGYNCGDAIGFSTMSMYTYLTTEFTQQGMTVYGGAPSVYTQNAHYAVNLIGGDFVMKTVFFANMIAILLGYFVMAVFFVFKTAFDILFKGIQLMGHALFAAVGFYKSIGTCICMTVNMVAQLFVTVVFFSFMVDLMFMTTSIMDHFAYDVFNTMVGSTDLSNGFSYKAEVLVIMSSLLATFVIIFFVSFAIKWRAFIMTTLNGMVENVVGTLLGVQLGGASEGVMGNMAKSAFSDAANVMTGAAAAAGGLAVADGAKDMVSDIANDFSGNSDDDSPTSEVSGTDSAADAAVKPTTNAAFDGGKGSVDYDGQKAEDGKKALDEGLGDKPESSTHESESGDTHGGGGFGDESDKKDENTEDTETAENIEGTEAGDGSVMGGYYYGGTAEQQAEWAKEAAENGDPTFTDNNGNEIMTRNDITADTVEAESVTAETLSVGSESSEEAEAENEDGVVLFGGKVKKGNPRRPDADDETEEASSESSDGVSTNDTTSGSSSSGSTNTAIASVNNTDDISGLDSNNSVETEEIEQGTEWQQVDNSTGAESGISFDPARGIVMTTVNDDGTVSDVAIGANGISTSSVDDEGNKTVTNISEDGVTTSYTGTDGTTETTEASFDGLNSNVKVTRTNADGDVEEITSGLDGTTYKHTETAADGSTRETVTDANGNTTITETNATTGYESVEQIDSAGNSVKTEEVNGVTTVTETNSEGEVTARQISKLDANGQEVSSGYQQLEDGTVVETTTANGVTTKMVTEADGNRTEIVTSVRDDGTTVETTTDYGNDAVADSVSTTVRSANGMEVLYQSDTTAGEDATGAYNKTVTTTAAGTTETLTYTDGRVVTTETAANGDTSVTEAHTDGSYTVTENDVSTGERRVTTINKHGEGETIVTDAGGNEIDRIDVPENNNGGFSYTNIAGGTISTETVGSGADRQIVTSQSYVTGGGITETESISGNRVTTVTDGVGSETTTSYDAQSGNVSTTFVHASGNSGSSVLEADGDYRQTVQLAGGGTVEVERTGTGSNTVEHYERTDSLGHQTIIDSEGGQVTHMSSSNGAGTSYTQRYDEATGNTVVQQTLGNGDVVSSVVQADGDFTSEITHSNGGSTVVASEDGVTTYKHVSSTGIETTAMRQGSVTTTETEYAGITMTQSNDTVTGELTRTFTTTAGQSYSVTTEADGGEKTVFEMPNGTYASSKVNDDGSKVNIIRQPDGTSRVENITTSGESSVVYMNSKGETITEANSVTRLNDAYAESVAQFNSNMQGANDFIAQMDTTPAFSNIQMPDLSNIQIPNQSVQGLNLNAGVYGADAYSTSGSGSGNLNPMSNQDSNNLNFMGSYGNLGNYESGVNDESIVQPINLAGSPTMVQTGSGVIHAAGSNSANTSKATKTVQNIFYKLFGKEPEDTNDTALPDVTDDVENLETNPQTFGNDTTRGFFGRDENLDGGSATNNKNDK